MAHRRQVLHRLADAMLVVDTNVAHVRALGSYRHFDARRGTERAWLIGIAHNVFRRHVGAASEARDVIRRLGGQLELGQDEIDELVARIDAQSTGRALLSRVAAFPEPERVALELVDVMQMPPKEAAQVVGVSAGTLRVRLFRARARLRKEGIDGI